jgi:pimeloyl-ACP methyl ester carboxylesterase
VLLHGAPQFSYEWRRVAPDLLSQMRVVIPDLRGYGASDLAASGRYDLGQLCEDLRVVVDATRRSASDAAVVVGHDWGGPIAWRFAERHPERVRHLVAINGPHPGAMARELRHLRQAVRSWYIALFQVPGSERLAGARDASFLGWMMSASSPAGVLSDEDLATYRAALSRPGRADAVLAYYRQAFRGTAEQKPRSLRDRWREAADAPRIDVPTTIVWGDADLCLAPTHPDATRRYASRLEVRGLPGAGHWVPEERPSDVVRAILDAERATA